jgi:mannitol 2-dehydrogenase
LRYLRGVDFDGLEIAVKDARKEELQPLAIRDGAHPRAIFLEASIFGDLAEDADFVAGLRAAARALDRDGPRATVDAYLRRAAMPTEVAA